jgi:hypothetical protein
LGIGDWGLGIGDWGLGPIPNPQSQSQAQTPIPMLNPNFFISLYLNIFNLKLNLNSKYN